MNLLHNVSLGHKLTIIIMLTSSVALLVACFGMAAYDVFIFRRSMLRDLVTHAEILGNNSTAALSFGEANSAREVLMALKAEPRVVSACIYGRDNLPFAVYVRNRVVSVVIPPQPQPDGSYFRPGRVLVFHQIKLDGERIGTIYIESDLDEMHERIRNYAAIVLLAMLASSALAYLLASRLQLLISGPILSLVQTARRISVERNYGLRASPQGSDELGLLVGGFNGMLAQIQQRDKEVDRQRADLEREVAARTAINLQLQVAKETAEAASIAKGEFLANMSHEIRTPINGIMGMTELTLDTELTAEQRENLGMVKSSADALLSVINDILDFSKVESGKLNLETIEFDPYTCVGEAIRTLALRAHQKGLELAYDAQPDMPRQLMGDPGRLRQILVNLIGNAIKFTEHGEVVVSIASSLEADGMCTFRFAVRDTGIGIAHEKRALLFRPFSQADSSTTRKYGGTGLGLAISMRLVEMMGGEMWLESEEGKGSTFYFTVKMLPAALVLATSHPAAKSELVGVRILLVDDNETNRTILNGMALVWGMRPYTVSSGELAIAAIHEASAAADPFRVVVIDVCMPVMDGFQLAESIHDDPSLAGATIMLLTSGGNAGDAARCRQLGVSAYLLKPVLKVDLLNAILTIIGQRETTPVLIQPLVTRHSLREASRNLHILIADDNAVNQALIVRILVKLGHSSVVAVNGREAIALAAKEKFDLVFMDVQMPEMDGLAATGGIRALEKNSGAHLPIFAMTAHAMKGDRERCMAAGMDGYISKPLRVSDIERTLAGVETSEVRALLVHAETSSSAWGKAEALQRLNGDEDLLRELCQIFLAETPKLIGKLRQSVSALDSAGVMFSAHSIKGELSYLGAPRALKAASDLEDMARNNDLSLSKEALFVLEQELSGLQLGLQNMVGAAS